MRPKGFSLLELVMVTAILGIVAAIAVPRLNQGSAASRYASTAASLRKIANAIMLYQADTLSDPADWDTGDVPPEGEPYLDPEWFEEPSPLGGHWDIETHDTGIQVAVGITFDEPHHADEEQLRAVDAILDDGDLTTGAFREIDDGRYYLIIRE